MVVLSRRALFPFLAPPLGYSVFSAVPPNHIQASETPSFLLATAPYRRISVLCVPDREENHKRKGGAPNIALNFRT